MFVGALPGSGRVRQRRPPSNAAASFLRPTAGKQNGSIVSSLGIGSGVLKIPALDTALRLPIKVSSATSNFMIGVTAAASGVAYFARGDIDPAIAGPVALGSVIRERGMVGWPLKSLSAAAMRTKRDAARQQQQSTSRLRHQRNNGSADPRRASTEYLPPPVT